MNILNLAISCGEKLPDLRELQTRNEQVKKAMEDLGIPTIKNIYLKD